MQFFNQKAKYIFQFNMDMQFIWRQIYNADGAIKMWLYATA